MVKISLQIKATLENVHEFYTDHPNYKYIVKLKCVNCREISEKWHDIIESNVSLKTGAAESNFVAKCKFCGRENSLDIVENSNGKYLNEDQGKFKSIIIFDCRGFEPIEFSPGDGWMVKIEDNGTLFENVDLSEKEWVEYDDKIKQSVGIYEFESRFVKVK